ncbi:E3 ubiquitin-protein ligase RNF34-like isoform X2 [Acanthaster planci]|nr:E3 ubiquitin-protein ligase RNF34-like isoform X2 [Acanthaster planci]
MGSAAGRPAQGSAAFTATFSPRIFSRPQSRTQQTPQGRYHSTSHSSQFNTPQTRQPNTTQGRQQEPGISNRSQPFQPLDKDGEVSMVCESCSANFTIFKRKNRCMDCSKLFCTNCMSKEPRKCCKTCHMFIGSTERSQLMQFKVKDLRQYLAARNINTVACREKGELVDLVVQYLATRNGSKFTVTVNNLEEEVQPMPTPVTNEAVRAERGPSISELRSSQTQVSDTRPQPNRGPVRQTHDEPDIGITRNTWVEGSSASSSEAERSPVVSISSPEDEPSSTTATPEQPKPAPARHRTSISDLKTIDEIADLTVRQLKEILILNFINYKGCVERWELEERVRRLYTEKEGFKIKEQAAAARTSSDAPKAATVEHEEDNTCRICMDSPIDCVLLECGHMVTCTKCGKQLAECPMCRQYIIRAVHVFRS